MLTIDTVGMLATALTCGDLCAPLEVLGKGKGGTGPKNK